MTGKSVRTPNSDLSRCDGEPIHIPDAIQPHGCLLVADPDTHEILQVSANLAHFPGLEQPVALGRPLGDVLPVPMWWFLDECGECVEGGPPKRSDLALEAGDGTEVAVMVSLYRSGAALVVEVEAYPPESETSDTVFRALESFHFGFHRIASSMSVLQTAVDEVVHRTGYDHVMAYRFDDDWNGEVTAERRGEASPSFLGHCFPASDIPAQARALYAVNPVRHMPDVGYEAVPLEPALNPLTQASLDMTWCATRSISPIHREYMRNMGVESSLSLSLLIDGRLWGMILCHHSRPYRISPILRSYLRMVVQSTGHALRVALQRESEADAEAIVGQMRAVLNELEHEDRGLLSALQQRCEILQAFDAETLVVRLHGQTVTLGREVPQHVIRTIEQAVAGQAGEAPVSSSRIRERIPSLRSDTSCSWLGGFLYARLSRDRDDALLFLRGERVRDELWAGDPDGADVVVSGDGVPRIHPRRSFKAWKREVRGFSLPWSEGDHIAAERLMNGLASRLAGEVERLLRHRANHDALTQLPNRNLLDDRRDHVCRRVKRTGEHVVVLFVDLDGFKPVNDRHGHEVGDLILQRVAERFAAVLRGGDTVARVGGDEFVCLLEGFRDIASAREDGAACARRLVAELEALHFEQDGIQLSSSVGIAIHPLDGEDPESLLRAADQAMYSIKGQPDRHYVFSTPFQPGLE